jgi:hypothetical protein
VGLARRKTAPAKVEGEGGGCRPRRPQCRRASESTGQCACTGVSKGCGWKLSRRLNSIRGDEPRGAPASSGRRRWWAREATLSSARANAREGEVRGASGGPKGTHACQGAQPAGPGRVGRGAWPRRWCAHGAARPSAARVGAGVRARGRGPGHDDRRVVLAVTAYGRRAMWA